MNLSNSQPIHRLIAHLQLLLVTKRPLRKAILLSIVSKDSFSKCTPENQSHNSNSLCDGLYVLHCIVGIYWIQYQNQLIRTVQKMFQVADELLLVFCRWLSRENAGIWTSNICLSWRSIRKVPLKYIVGCLRMHTVEPHDYSLHQMPHVHLQLLKIRNVLKVPVLERFHSCPINWHTTCVHWDTWGTRDCYTGRLVARVKEWVPGQSLLFPWLSPACLWGCISSSFSLSTGLALRWDSQDVCCSATNTL